MIKGNLSSFSLGEIFQSLAVNNHTGTLKIVEKNAEEKYIYFSRGEISLFSIRTHPSLRIGEILIRQGKISKADLQKALEQQKESAELLGKILMKNCGLKQEDIQQALETKICEEIYDLFLLTDAEFEFYVNHFPEEIFDSFQRNLRITINTYSVLMEGVRRADEWRVIQKKLQTFNEIFTLAVAPAEIEPQNPMEEALLKMLDGKTNVRRLFEKFPGSRFDCCKLIFEFLEAGRIRPLTLEECRAGGSQATSKKDFERSIDFLQFGVELSPNRPEPLCLLGQSLIEIGRDQPGRECLLKAAQLYFQSGQFQEVIQYGGPLVIHFPQNESLLEMVFQAALNCGKLSLLEACGDKLADLLVAKGALVHAAEVLSKVAGHFPKDLNRKIRIATLLKEAGDLSGAIARYEEAAASITGHSRISEKIRILRLIFEIAPDRQDIKQEVSNLLSLQQKLEHRKKRRITIAGAGIILLLVSMVVPILYEIKARELVSHAWRLEQMSLNSGDFKAAKVAYEKVLDSYGLSLQVQESRVALERISTFEHLKEEKVLMEKKRQESLQEEKLRLARDSFTAMVDEAKGLEERGEYQEAFNIYKKLSEEFQDIPKVQSLLFPLVITTNPRGCFVQLNGANLGAAPLVIHKRKGETLSIQFSRTGCESTQRTAVVGESWRLHVDMNLRPLSEFKLSGPVHQAADLQEGDLYLASRDGTFYAASLETQALKWQRQIGKFGDVPSNPLYTPAEIILGNVSGEVAAISRKTGKSRWRINTGAAVAAMPAISPDGKWAAVGDLEGKVSLINHVEGKFSSSFTAENEILYAPAFWENLLLAASEDNHLYFLSVPELKLVHAETFTHEIDCDLMVRENSLFYSTRNGVLHRYHLARRRLEWSCSLGDRLSTQLILHGNSILLGTRAGKVLSLQLQGGSSDWSLAASSSALGEFTMVDDQLVLGTVGGEILAVSLTRHSVDWKFRSDEAVIKAPLVWKNHLYAITVSGKIFVLEIFK
ncbi:MAG: PQQ-binding-like beta-propeller repeat protein [Planctomycetes bacterium]|nr:PQQ-binding-like beta-propeller repeat protein [Planctomycetota bacterium]